MKIRNKKGFTLLELTIVLALLAMVVSMTLGYILQFRNSSNMIDKKRAVIADVAIIRNVVKNWVQYYDNPSYTIVTSEKNDYAQANGDSDSGKLLFKDGSVVWIKNGEETAYLLEAVNGIDFIFDKFNITKESGELHEEENNNVLRVRVYFNGTQFQDIAVTVFSTTTRERFSASNRGDI